MFSYIRSKGRGDLNDFGSFLGTFPLPIVRPNQFGNSAGGPAQPVPDLGARAVALEIPHRAGDRIPQRLSVRRDECRPGLCGNSQLQRRFPRFLSVDSRVSKDFQVHPQYAVRLSVSAFNLTNHFNPEAVHSNVADPAFGYFFGHRGRRFTLDFDVLF